MSEKAHFAFGKFLLQLALGVMLAVGGILVLVEGGDVAAKTITKIFNGQVGEILKYVFGVIELLAGIFMVLELFIGNRMGTFGKVLNIIVMVIWVLAVFLMDFGWIFGGKFNFSLGWLYALANHVLILGAMIYLMDE